MGGRDIHGTVFLLKLRVAVVGASFISKVFFFSPVKHASTTTTKFFFYSKRVSKKKKKGSEREAFF